MLLYFYLFSANAYAAKLAIELDVNGAIGPATQDFIQRGIEYAYYHKAELIILRLDTPGGLETSMRGIDKAILASPIPVVTYVAPAGARAASAGTFILYASHVAAMAPGTNVGAASPVEIGGITNSPSEENKKPSTMEKKIMNDAAAYIRSLAQLRGRNVLWGEGAVRQAGSISAEEALKQKVINFIAQDVPSLLKQLNNYSVDVLGTKKILQTNDMTVEPLSPDWRYQFLAIITDPSVAYILLLIGIYGLFFEFYNPGFILPGVAGTICLLLALYAFQLLPINYAGFGLLILGIVFMIAEVFLSSFGVLAIGGIIAFIVGSVFLLDSHVAGFSIAWQLILMMSLISIGFFMLVIHLTFQSIRRKVVTGQEMLIGTTGVVIDAHNNNGQVKIHGEIWNANAKVPLKSGQKIRVTHVSGLLLTVEPLIDENQTKDILGG